MRKLIVAVALSYSLAEFGGAQKTLEMDSGTFAAVAVSESMGKYGYAYNFRSRRVAEKEALKQCDAPDAKIACWINFGFIALGRSDEKSCWGVGWSYGRGCNTRDAMIMALDNVDKYCTNPAGAYVALLLSSGGELIREQRDKNAYVDEDGVVHEGLIATRPGASTTVVTKDGNVYRYDAQGRPIEVGPSPSAAGRSILGDASAKAGKN